MRAGSQTHAPVDAAVFSSSMLQPASWLHLHQTQCSTVHARCMSGNHPSCLALATRSPFSGRPAVLTPLLWSTCSSSGSGVSCNSCQAAGDTWCRARTCLSSCTDMSSYRLPGAGPAAPSTHQPCAGCCLARPGRRQAGRQAR